MGTDLFNSFINRQKEAIKFLYLQNKRLELKSLNKYNESDILRKQILEHGLKILESENRFFIY